MDSSTDISQLCRLCLLKDKVNTPIFEGQGDIGHVYKKISSLLPVKVAEDDKLPKSICDSCTLKLDMFYEFWQMSGQSEKKLLEWLNETEPNNINQPTETIVKQEAIDINDKLEVFMNVPTYGQDFFEETTTTVDEPQAKRPKRATAAKAAATLHETDDEDDPSETLTKMEDESEGTEGEDQESAIVNVPSTSADSQPGPSGVGKESSEAPLLDKRKYVQCSFCRGKFGSKADLRCHMENLEAFLKLFCKNCKNFIRVDEAIFHFDITYSCTMCKLILHNGTYLGHSCLHNNANQRLASSLRRECGVCEKLFFTEDDIHSHIAESHSKVKLKTFCKCCQLNFTSKRELEKHNLAHINSELKKPEKPEIYRCLACNSVFDSEKKMELHKKAMHSEKVAAVRKGSENGKSPNSGPSYKICNICKKSFKNASALRCHKLSHTR